MLWTWPSSKMISYEFLLKYWLSKLLLLRAYLLLKFVDLMPNVLQIRHGHWLFWLLFRWVPSLGMLLFWPFIMLSRLTIFLCSGLWLGFRVVPLIIVSSLVGLLYASVSFSYPSFFIHFLFQKFPLFPFILHLFLHLKISLILFHFLQINSFLQSDLENIAYELSSKRSLWTIWLLFPSLSASLLFASPRVSYNFFIFFIQIYCIFS